jgi:outer membrane protein insertion porin family
VQSKSIRLLAFSVAAGAWLLLAGVAAGVEVPRDTVIEVRIEGNSRMSRPAILSYIKTRLGQVYDKNTVGADKRRLMKSGHFNSVTVTRTQAERGMIVTFIVDERAVVAELKFQGNKSFKPNELAGELVFGVGSPLTRFSVEAGRQAIVSLYKRSGFHRTTVTLDKDALIQNRVIFIIAEGPQVKVRKIRFKGNSSFRGMTLRRKMGSSQRIWPFWQGYFDSEQVDRDIQSIRNFYVSEGFLDAEIGRELVFSDNKERLTLTFIINEGPHYRIKGVLFRGNKVFSDDELARRIKFREGEHFTSLTMYRDETALRDTYGEAGYIQNTVIGSKLYKNTPGLVDVVFTVTEGNQFTVGTIDIRGNTKTQGRIIRRDIRVSPTQLFNIVALRESRVRLMETGLFQKISLTPVGDDPKVRNLLVEIIEGNTAQFLIGAGVSTNSGLLGNISFTQRNFNILSWPTAWKEFFQGESMKGAGQTLRIVAEPGTKLMRFHIEWFEPRLFDKPYSVGTKMFVFTRGRESYDEQRYGGVVSFGHRFKNRWYGEVATRIEGVDISGVDAAAPKEVMADAGTHLLLGVKGTLVRDRTDSRWMPSKGDRIRISVEQMVGSYNFNRVTNDYRMYRTLYLDALDRKHILATRFSAAAIAGDAPVFEKFYGGGIGSVRGFEYRGISPRGTGTSDPIGGDMMVFAGAEYTFPIAGKYLRGAAFLDTGTVADSFSFSTYRASVGFGVRWIIPMMGPVPLSLDFAFPISKSGDDDTQMLNFSLGWTF